MKNPLNKVIGILLILGAFTSVFYVEANLHPELDWVAWGFAWCAAITTAFAVSGGILLITGE